MSKTVKPHKISIRNMKPGEISSGMNTEVLIDGKPLKLCKFAKVEFHSKRLTKVTIEMFADVEIEDIEVEEIKEK